jgi:molecular chaperone DnaK (HSP70)
MKNTILFLLLILGTFTTQSQVLVKMSPRAEMPKTTAAKPKTTKTKIVYVDRPVTTKAMSKTTIKFVCDANAILFIDGEKKGILQKDIPMRVSLPKGEYIIKAVHTEDENYFLEWNYKVYENGDEKLEKINFKYQINKLIEDDIEKKFTKYDTEYKKMVEEYQNKITKYDREATTVSETTNGLRATEVVDLQKTILKYKESAEHELTRIDKLKIIN